MYKLKYNPKYQVNSIRLKNSNLLEKKNNHYNNTGSASYLHRFHQYFHLKENWMFLNESYHLHHPDLNDNYRIAIEDIINEISLKKNITKL